MLYGVTALEREPSHLFHYPSVSRTPIWEQSTLGSGRAATAPGARYLTDRPTGAGRERYFSVRGNIVLYCRGGVNRHSVPLSEENAPDMPDQRRSGSSATGGHPRTVRFPRPALTRVEDGPDTAPGTLLRSGISGRVRWRLGYSWVR